MRHFGRSFTDGNENRLMMKYLDRHVCRAAGGGCSSADSARESVQTPA
jgi:hypothetical protein